MGKIGYVPLKDIKFCNIPLKDHFFAIYHQKVTMLLVCITSVNFANASLFCTQSSSSLALPAQTQPHRRGKVQWAHVPPLSSIVLHDFSASRHLPERHPPTTVSPEVSASCHRPACCSERWGHALSPPPQQPRPWLVMVSYKQAPEASCSRTHRSMTFSLPQRTPQMAMLQRTRFAISPPINHPPIPRAFVLAPYFPHSPRNQSS